MLTVKKCVILTYLHSLSQSPTNGAADKQNDFFYSKLNLGSSCSIRFLLFVNQW